MKWKHLYLVHKDPQNPVDDYHVLQWSIDEKTLFEVIKRTRISKNKELISFFKNDELIWTNGDHPMVSRIPSSSGQS